MKHKELVVFPDTNCLLHYPCIQEIDWRLLCDAEVVRLILSRQVIAELDQKKSHPTLRDRADRIIKEIRGLRKKGGQVRDHVTIEVYSKDISVSDYPPDLNHDSQDDRIVCHVLAFAKECDPVPVAVVTEDLGMELRCETFNVVVIEPGRESRLPNPTTELDKKYTKAVQELQSLQNMLPRIEIAIGSDEDQFEAPCRVALLDPGPEPDNIESMIAGKRRELTITRPIPPKPPLEKSESAIEMKSLIRTADLYALGQSFSKISDEEYSRYERDLESYLVKYRCYLDYELRWHQDRSRAFRFWLKFVNNGNAPATDLHISLQFNPVLQALVYNRERVGHLSKAVKEPETPTRPRRLNDLSAFGASFGGMRLPDLSPRHATPDFGYYPDVELSGKSASGFILQFSSSKLSHHKPIVVGPIVGIFKKLQMVKPFQIEATITADNIPTANQKKLNILIDTGR